MKIGGISRGSLATGQAQQLFCTTRSACEFISNIVETPSLVATIAVTTYTLFSGEEEEFVCVETHFCLTDVLEYPLSFLSIVSSSPTETIIATCALLPKTESVIGLANHLLVRWWGTINEIHAWLR